jgi:transposase
MTKITTRNQQYSENNATLYLAFELSSSEWKLGFSTGLGQKARRRNIEAGDLDKLKAEIAAAKKRFLLPETARVVSCYEAGRESFWLHRYLTESGVENLVVDSSSIEVKRRERKAKTDRLDVQKLLIMLIRYHLGERKVWSVVQVPSPEEEDRGQFHRELSALGKERTRTSNRIKGLLATQGIRLKGRLNLSEDQLDAIRLWDGSELPVGLKNRLKWEWEHLSFIEVRIRSLETDRRRALRQSEAPDSPKIQQLAMLRGIGPNGAWVLVREFFGWRKFNNRKELGSLAGLTPTPFRSGALIREQGISKAGNRHVREIAIELGWSWVRYQPESKLTLWFLERFGNGGPRARKIGIVALSRRLLIDLWRFLETGAVPEGAELKANS